jgi:hypothetical protein
MIIYYEKFLGDSQPAYRSYAYSLGPLPEVTTIYFSEFCSPEPMISDCMIIALQYRQIFTFFFSPSKILKSLFLLIFYENPPLFMIIILQSVLFAYKIDS